MKRLWIYEKDQSIEVWKTLEQVIKKIDEAKCSGQNIWNKVKKSSKIDTCFLQLLTAVTKVWIVEGRLSTKLYVHTILTIC